MKFGATILLTLASTLSVVSGVPVEKRAPSIVPGDSFDKFFMIVFENMDYRKVAANPYFSSLAKKGNLLTNYHAITHPSQPNYIAMISGSTQGCKDNKDYNFESKNLIDILEPKDISWKAYQENYPGDCYLEDSLDKLYRRKHNPFISFTDITTNPTRCAKIVNADELDTDLANHALPQFSFFTPNMNNDGHDTSVSFAADWLERFIEDKLSNPAFMTNTAILVTFDEDDSSTDSRKNVSEKNRIHSILLGGAVHSAPGTTDNTAYNHFSILATLEKNWKLDNLSQKDVGATSFAFLGKA
ncbi:hypothetical protein BG000_001043 [Podila horticola]|nr:hypothetical protein BG000_001043 [Podila horticola]